MWIACGVAVIADTIQLFLGPLGWAGVDDAIDVVVMVVLSITLGFHPLFLPTFVAKLIPVVDMFPTWTGCALYVIAVRRKQFAAGAPPVAPPPTPHISGDVIDI